MAGKRNHRCDWSGLTRHRLSESLSSHICPDHEASGGFLCIRDLDFCAEKISKTRRTHAGLQSESLPQFFLESFRDEALKKFWISRFEGFKIRD